MLDSYQFLFVDYAPCSLCTFKQGDFFKVTRTDISEMKERMKINVSRNLFGLKGNLRKYVNQIKNTPFTPQLPLTQKC